MATNKIQKLRDGLRAARDEVLSAIDGITEQEAHQIPAPDEWSVAQLLAHIAELQVFWVGKAVIITADLQVFWVGKAVIITADLQVFWVGKAVIITKEGDPQISRTAVESHRRIAAVTDHAQDSLDDLKREMLAACEEAVAMVGRINPQDLNRPGHREDNPMTAGGVIQYLGGHVRDHANQIAEARRLIRQMH